MPNLISVLVVDDDPVSSAQLGALATAAGYDVKSAYNGREAWELLQLARVPIVISDWYMPEMDGPELCRRIRSRVREPYVYFILVTSRGGKQQYRSEEHTSELQSPCNLVCRLLLEKKKKKKYTQTL